MTQYCELFEFRNNNGQLRRVLGLYLGETDTHLEIKTGKGFSYINKDKIVERSPTRIVFQEGR